MTGGEATRLRFAILELLEARERLLDAGCPECEGVRLAVDGRLMATIARLERLLGSGGSDSDGGERR
jgi:hypothetical protein